jgi:hypothetical protein
MMNVGQALSLQPVCGLPLCGADFSLRGSSRTRSSRTIRPAWTPAAGLESRPTIIP